MPTRPGEGRRAGADRVVAHQGERVFIITRALGRREATIRLWVTPFNAQGMDGLHDGSQPRRLPIYIIKESEVVADSPTKPNALERLFGSWTLDRLTVYLNETNAIPITRRRLGKSAGPKACAGEPRRPSLMSGSIRRSPKRQGDHCPPHRTIAGQCGGVPGQDRTGERQKSPGNATCARGHVTAVSASGHAGG